LNPLYSKELNKNITVSNTNDTKCEINLDIINCTNYNIDNDLKVRLFEDPYRIRIDFEDNITFIKNSLQNNLIREIRYSHQNIKGSRLVLDMPKPGIITDIIYEKYINGINNLKIKIKKTTAAKFAIAKYIIKNNNGNLESLNANIIISKQQKKLSSDSQISPQEKPIISNKNKPYKKYIVFIDPGHGGKDPGAIGQLGTREKDITLKASILLAEKLRKIRIITPILSRNKDIYLPLRQRTKLAKKNNADIFISIHADSSRNRKAKGLSVFSLSNKASDKEAEMLAKRENNVDNILDDKNIINDPLIYGSLIKMFQREAMNESSFLARKILINLEKTKLTVNRGHRFAGFAVLKSYDIPSILIEIGFLSNKSEEKRLLNRHYLNELTDGLTNAIEDYFKNSNKKLS
jgi:N-acetylmuramoyl-L-alanine amidase